MKTITISNSYNIKWQLKEYPYIQITTCKKLIDTQKNVILKRVIKGGYSIGYNIKGKFIPLSKLNDYCEKIKYEYYPF